MSWDVEVGSVEINEFVMANEKAIRMGVFFGILGLMALWEITMHTLLPIQTPIGNRIVNNL